MLIKRRSDSRIIARYLHPCPGAPFFHIHTIDTKACRCWEQGNSCGWHKDRRQRKDPPHHTSSPQHTHTHTSPSHMNQACGQRAQTHPCVPAGWLHTLFKSNNLDSFTLLLVSFFTGIHFFALSLRDHSCFSSCPSILSIHPHTALAPLICAFSPREDPLWDPRPLPVPIWVSPSCTFTHAVASHLCQIFFCEAFPQPLPAPEIVFFQLQAASAFHTSRARMAQAAHSWQIDSEG